jgi:hypothetical protein
MTPLSDVEMAEMAQILDVHGVEGESTTYALVLLLREAHRARAEVARLRAVLNDFASSGCDQRYDVGQCGECMPCVAKAALFGELRP